MRLYMNFKAAKANLSHFLFVFQVSIFRALTSVLDDF